MSLATLCVGALLTVVSPEDSIPVNQQAVDTAKKQTTLTLGSSTTGGMNSNIGPTYHFNNTNGIGVNMATLGATLEHQKGKYIYTGTVSGLAGTFRKQNYPANIWSNYLYDMNIALKDTMGTRAVTLGQEGSNSIIGTFQTDQAYNALGIYPEAANNSPYGLTNLRITFNPGKGRTINIALTNGFQKTFGDFDQLTTGLNITKNRVNGFYASNGLLINNEQFGTYPAVGWKDTKGNNTELGGYIYEDPSTKIYTGFIKGGVPLKSGETVNGLFEVLTGTNGKLVRAGVNLEFPIGSTGKGKIGGGIKNQFDGRGVQPFVQATISTGLQKKYNLRNQQRKSR